MAASPTAAASSRIAHERTRLLDFLRRELAPFPGRSAATARIVVACVAVLVACMTLRVPEAHLAVWIVFKIALEESGETLLMGVAALVLLTIAIAFGLVLLIVALDQPSLRFAMLGLCAGLGFFLRRAFVIGNAGFLLGLISTIVLTLPDFVPTSELMVRFALWLWAALGLGIVGAVAANLFLAPVDPAVLLREELLRRVRAAEAAIARRLAAAASLSEPARALRATERLLELLRDAGIMHPSLRGQHARTAALIEQVDRLATAAAALEALRSEPNADERALMAELRQQCDRAARAIATGETIPASTSPRVARTAAIEPGSALRPVLAELDHALARIEALLGAGRETSLQPAPEPARRSVFVADAFTNPEYLRYAVKGSLAVMICYLIQSAVDWPGIRTCIITCMIVGLASEGATVQKGTLRIAGALVGGALGFLAILALVPTMESITSLALLVAAGSAVAAWVYVGSPRISYAGVQIAFAFYVCVIQDFGPSWYFYTIRDRLVGILLGNLVISLVFVSVWPVRAGTGMWQALGCALRAMADLARVGGDDQAAVALEITGLRERVARHFATAQQSAEEDAFEWTVRAGASAARERFAIAIAEARSVFALQLAVASQRPNVAPASLPAELIAGTRRFDALLAGNLDAIAARARSAASDAPPDLHTPLDSLREAARVHRAQIDDREVRHQVEGRVALYRELLPHIDQLASAVRVA